MSKLVFPNSSWRQAGLRLVQSCVGALLLAMVGPAFAASGGMLGCSDQEARVRAAWRLQQRNFSEEALKLASRVSLLEDCWVPYVSAQRLTGQVLGLQSDRIDEGIAAYRRGLQVDSRQSLLWYELGYLLYRRSDYPQALDALEKAILHLQTTPPQQPERFLMQCRLLYAEAADRLATLSLGARPEHLQRAVHGWQDYQDYCQDYGRCAAKDLKLAQQRLGILASQKRS